MPTMDIWAQLYSLEMTSKPYLREEKHVYLDNRFLEHPFCYVVCSAVTVKQPRRRVDLVHSAVMTMLQKGSMESQVLVCV